MAVNSIPSGSRAIQLVWKTCRRFREQPPLHNLRPTGINRFTLTQYCFLLLCCTAVTCCNGQDMAYRRKAGAGTARTLSAGQSEVKVPWTDSASLRSYRAQISQYIPGVFQDKAGNFWFGTNGDGVCRYDRTSLTYFTKKEGLGGNAVRSIVQDKNGNIWFATNGGVSRYDGKSFTTFTEKDGLINNEIWSVLEDKSGNLWFGTEGGVSRYDGKSFTAFPLPAADIRAFPKVTQPPKLIHCIFQDKTGRIWFGSNGGGAYCYDGKSLVNISEKDGLCNNVVRCIMQDRAGNLWFATRFGGVSRYDGKSFVNFTVDNSGLSSNDVWTMKEDRSGAIWFAALGAGVDRYDGKSFTHYSLKDGLVNRHVQSIAEDKTGSLWFGTSGGLFRYDRNSFVNITRDGPWW